MGGSEHTLTCIWFYLLIICTEGSKICLLPSFIVLQLTFFEKGRATRGVKESTLFSGTSNSLMKGYNLKSYISYMFMITRLHHIPPDKGFFFREARFQKFVLGSIFMTTKLG
ncbi:hypothetical protein RF11_09610 [Thelohanellus kitauei]|uniref:Uncharacterized protein n=1 Tax=Thelohanellus kitauei TaxID=669202 RepID=A0A0C2IK04_THEKT|nr:hypothetical protein RF11_09610 [Thelohanellus kitauei]